MLNGPGFNEYISKLPTDELDIFIDHMDKVPPFVDSSSHPLNLPQALIDLEPTSVAFGQILRKLQKICTSRMRLPSSYILPADELNINGGPFATGGFSDVFNGTYRGSVVCVKRLRVASTSSLENIRKGFTHCGRLFDFF
jgi:hypothetical protein